MSSVRNVARVFEYLSLKSDGTPIEFDRDLWTLSNFLQWLFRSAIREGKPVTLYLPSTRMRNLLHTWLQSDTM